MGLTTHALILSALALTQCWGAALAWLAGMGTVYPFIASIRQLLEHRALAPDAEAPVPYAATHRLFGEGPFASTFGGAGFNRHLLHHMEPQISCTRLAEVELFLNATSRASWLATHRTSYGRAFRELLRQAKPAANAGSVLMNPRP
jgi:fatty acid desaturase